MDALDLCYAPATELGRLIRARQLSPVELTEAVLSRIERLNPRLHAFLTVTADHARELARASEGRARQGRLLGPPRRDPVLA
jgi:Asp-tRNA(Asn)/Glu-tRNA(Gln) amidotransferase A subunit family amidase